MAELKTVGVRELKNKLSAYLREVRTGVHILVSDRDTVVAELHEPRLDYPRSNSIHPVLSEWVRSGTVTPAGIGKTKLDKSPVRLPDGASLRLLDEERGERTE
jgi:antitoxin (DNA-binding transcriptional repressor) of toxin-antitoxin stability system